MNLKPCPFCCFCGGRIEQTNYSDDPPGEEEIA